MEMLKENTRVALTWDPEQRGTLYRWGPEQCVVRFDDGRERIVLTNDLVVE